MASPLDELVDLPGGQAELDPYLNPTLAGETPDQTQKRQEAEQRSQETEQRRANVIKAADLQQRGIPAFKTASGDVTAITDEGGRALTHYDPTHDIAYDSQGQPKLISYGETGPPVLKDPFADLPVRTDESTGQQYKVRPGLPWQWVGEDKGIAWQANQEEKDKAIKEESALLGQKLSLDHADLVTAIADRKQLHSGLISEVPTLQDPKYAGANKDTVLKAIDDHYNEQYAAPEANQDTPESKQLRAGIDQKKADTYDAVNQLYGLNDHITQLGGSVSAAREDERARVDTLLAHKRGQLGPLDQPAINPEQLAAAPVDHVTQAIDSGVIPDAAQPAALAAAHDAEDANKKAVALEKTNPTLADQFKAAGEGIIQGLTHGLSSIVKAVGAAEKFDPGQMIARAITGTTPEQIAGKALEDVSKGAVDKELQGTLGSKAGNFIGEIAPWVGLTVLTKGTNVITPTVLGALGYASGYQDRFEDAKTHGLTDDQANLRAIPSGVINGLLLSFPGLKATKAAVATVFGGASADVIKNAITNTFEREGAEGVGNLLDQLGNVIRSGEKPVIRGAAQDVKAQALEAIESIKAEMAKTPAQRALAVPEAAALGAGAGAAAQTAQNVISRTYNPDTGLFEGVPEQAIGFGVLAGASAGFRQVLLARNAKRALDVIARGGEPPPTAGGLPAPGEPPPGVPPPPGPGPGERPVTGREVTPTDVAANEAATSPTNAVPEPTEAQKLAGNYQKGHVTLAGLDVSIENPAGTRRQPEYEPLVSHYGYVKGTVGADKDHVDIFVKQGTPQDWAGPVYVVDQKSPSGDFDEHKAIIGVNGHAEAIAEYQGNYQPGWKGGQAVTEFKNVDDFKHWLAEGKKGQPVSEKYGKKIEGGELNVRENIRQEPQIAPTAGPPVPTGEPTAEPAHPPSAEEQPVVQPKTAPAPAAPGRAEEGAAEPAVPATNVADAEQQLWHLTRRDNPQLLNDLRKQHGGHENYLDVLNQNIEQAQATARPETGPFTKGDIVKGGGHTYEVLSSDEGETFVREQGTKQRPERLPTKTIRYAIKKGDYGLEPAAEIAQVPTREQEGQGAPPTVEPSKAQPKYSGLGVAPQRVQPGIRERPVVRSVEEVKNEVQRQQTANAEALKNAGTELHFAPVTAGSGFETRPETAHISADAEKILEAAKVVRANGGDPVAWIASSHHEEAVHSLQFLAAGHDFDKIYNGIYQALPKGVKPILGKVYPDRYIPAELGAEYERMLIQLRDGVTITEAHHRDISALLPFLRGKQSEALENNVKRVIGLTQPGEAPIEAAAPEPPSAPVPEPIARGPPKLEDLKPTASFADRQMRRKWLEVAVHPSYAPSIVRATLRTLLQSGPRKEPSVQALNQAMRKLTPYLEAPPKSTSEWKAADQVAYQKQKAQLTRAINAKDWKAVIATADEFEAHWEERGISVPDDWARWARAKEDAQLALKRGGEKHAIETGEKPKGGKPEHIGVPPRGNVPTHEGEIREGGGGQTGGRGGAVERPAPSEVGAAPEAPAEKPAGRRSELSVEDAKTKKLIDDAFSGLAAAVPKPSLKMVAIHHALAVKGQSVEQVAKDFAMKPEHIEKVYDRMRKPLAAAAPRKIVAAAIKLPNGAVVTGKNHDAAYRKAYEEAEDIKVKRLLTAHEAEPGYVTNLGEWLTSSEAHRASGTRFSDETVGKGLAASSPLIGKTLPGIIQKDLPEDKVAPFLALARHLIAKGVDTPEALIAHIPETGRPYAQALWDTLRIVNRKLTPIEPEWNSLFSDVRIGRRPAVEPGVGPPGGAVAGEAGGPAQPPEAVGLPQPRGGEVTGGTGEPAGEKPAVKPGRGAGTGTADLGATTEPGLRPGEAEPPQPTGLSETGTIQEPSSGRGGSPVNHHIAPEDEIAPTGAVTKVRANIAAIKTLKAIEKDNRAATPDEKRTMAKYTGWGGLPQVFDPWGELGKKFNEQLKGLLTDDELSAARRSTINAHYTSRDAIEAMWDIARRVGFKGGVVAEYGAGIGHFFGLMPRDLAANSTFQAIERDPLSARILGALYPQARVKLGALQDVNTKPNSVDLFVGNVPFAQDGPRDDRYPSLNLHNYFIARELDDLKPGGVAIVITSAHTLDAQQKQREYLAGKAELVAAIRLPNDAFKASAGTEVNTDILVLRKPDAQRPQPESWTGVSQIPTYDNKAFIPINEYFTRHNNMILGLASREGSMYGPDEPAIIPFKDKELTLRELMGEASQRVPANVFGAIASAPEETELYAEAAATDKPGSFIVQGGKLFVVSENKELVPAGDINPRFDQDAVVKRAKDFVALRDGYKELLRAQINPESDEARVEELRANLNTLYDRYVKKHDPISKYKSSVFSDDPEFGLLASLETVKTRVVEGKRVRDYVKAAVFGKRTQFPHTEPTEAADTRDGMLTSLGYRGRIDPDYIASLTGKTAAQIVKDLENQNLAFLDSESGAWQINAQYLSGNVRTKVKAAKKAAEVDPRYQRNVDALEKVQPAPLPIADVSIRLGGAWIPQEIVSRFGTKLFNSRFQATYVPLTDSWVLAREAYTPEATSTYAGGEINGNRLFMLALNLKSPRVMDTVYVGDKKKQVFNPVKTAAAQAAQDKILAEFRRYINDTPDDAKVLEDAYNERFNGHVLPVHDGSHLVLPGSSSDVELRMLQKNAVWRIIQDGHAMIAVAVGGGKTYILSAAAMEMRRLGLSRKPMIVVENSTLPQFSASFRRMYPNANVLVGSKEDLSKAKRNQFMARIASGDWDAVVVARSSFDRLPSDPEREKTFINGMLVELEDAIREAGAREGKRGPSVKDLEKAKDRLEERLKELADRPKDNVLNFEELGVDALLIDEAHNYKKPPFVTKMDRIAGLQKQISKRAFALLMKTRFIQEKNNGRNVVLSTGTPVTNTLGEAWHMMNISSPHILEDYGVDTFDRFVSTFATVDPSMDLNAAGNWVIKPRLKRFVNGPEFLTMLRSSWEVVTTEELHEMLREANVDVPYVKGGRTRALVVPITKPVATYMGFIRQVYDMYQKSTDKKSVSAVPVLAYMSARVAALDPRLVDPRAEDAPDSKVNTLLREVTRVYKETAKDKSTQLIFAENYRPFNIGYLRRFAAGQGIGLNMADEEQNLEQSEGGFNLWNDIRDKLVAQGIPPNEIANINDYDTAEKKDQLFDGFNAGRVRILMGGTEKLGTGVNVQEKAYALWHLDMPWFPAHLEQREGRIVRQGNENKDVEVASVGMERTMDAGLASMMASKAKFFRQVLSGKFSGREFDDPTGPLILSAEEQMALLSGNPLVLKKVEVDNRVRNLLLEQEGFNNGKSQTRYRLLSEEAYARDAERDLATLEAGYRGLAGKIDGKNWMARIGAQELNERKSIVAAIDRIVDGAKVTKPITHGFPGDAKTNGDLIVSMNINGVDIDIYGGRIASSIGTSYGGAAGHLFIASIFSVEGHSIYAGEAKTGTGILGVLSDLTESVVGRTEGLTARIAVAKADAEKFRADLSQPFDKAEELAAAQAEQAAINKALLGEGDDAKKGANELFQIGYSAVPLLMRIDAATTRAQNEIDNLRLETGVETSAGVNVDDRATELEGRIKALSARRNAVEKLRYEATLRGDMTDVPYAWTPTGKPSRPLAAANPIDAKAVKQAFAPGIDILKDIKEGVQSLLLPSAQSPEHLRSAETVGSKLGPMHRRQEGAGAAIKKSWLMFEKMGIHREDVPLVKNPGMQFQSDMSMGRQIADPEQQAAAKLYEKLFDSRVAAAEAAGAPLSVIREHYFPGMWTRESVRAFNAAVGDALQQQIIPEDFDLNNVSPTQESWIRDRTYKYLDDNQGSDVDRLSYLSRSPLKGSEKFRKPKVFDDVMMAVRLGLIPVSTNPADIVMLKLAELDRNIMFHELRMELESRKEIKTITPRARVPEGWEKVNDRYGTVYGPPSEAPEEGEPSPPYTGLHVMGYRIVKKPMGDILNNYLSSSLYNNRYFGTLFTGWMATANALNQTQLGVGSAFHAGFTTAEAQVSAGANVIKDIYGLIRGNRTFNQLLKTVGKAFTASVDTAITGDAVLNAWRNPDGTIDPRVAQVVRAAELAGAGFKLELGLQTQQTSKFLSDWLNGHRIRAAARSPIALVEMMAKPIMELLVPRQKAGVFAHLAWRIIEQNPGKSLDELRPEFRQAWNRVDARLGQVRYDRLFINNVAKNVVQGTIRAPGWSAGTVAELGGAFKDAYGFFEEFAKTGKLPRDIPDRVAYLISLLVTVAVLNAVLTWLFTHEKPEGLDYWAFRTGGKDLHGSPERFVLPTYVKDIMSYVKQPFTTLINKTHPLLSVFGDLLKNKDYYGVEIRNSDSNALVQAEQSGAYIAKAFTPFWIRGAQKQAEQGGISAKTLLPLIGVMPAPRKLTETAAQAEADKINEANLPAAPLTERQAERRLDKSRIASEIRRGIAPNISGALASGTIKPTDIGELYKRARLAPIAAQVEHMTLENAEKVYLRADAKERQELAGVMARKRANSLSRQGRTMFTGF